MSNPINIGTKTKYGKVVGILWLGERYYMIIKNKVVSLMPACVIEGE